MAKKSKKFRQEVIQEADKMFEFMNNPKFVAGETITELQAEGLNSIINFMSVLMRHDMDRIAFENETEKYIKRLLSINASMASGMLAAFDKLPPEVGSAFFTASTKHIMEDPDLANETQEVLKMMRDKAEKSGDDTEVNDILDQQFDHIMNMQKQIKSEEE
mgnify:CR=1 FL=1